MPLTKFKKLLYFVFHFSLCFLEIAVIGLTSYIIAQILQYKLFIPFIAIVPAILIIILNIIQLFGFYKGFYGILESNKTFVLILCVFIVLNSIFDVFIGLWSVTVRDGIYNSVNNTMEILFINYTQLHYKKEEWNNLQYELKCCGIEGPQSYTKVRADFLPISCCNTTMKTDSICESGVFYKKGCLDLLTNYVHEQLYNFIVVVLLFVVVQIIAIVVYCHLNTVLCKKSGKLHISTSVNENKNLI